MPGMKMKSPGFRSQVVEKLKSPSMQSLLRLNFFLKCRHTPGGRAGFPVGKLHKKPERDPTDPAGVHSAEPENKFGAAPDKNGSWMGHFRP